jgi:transmembrane protein DUF3566
VSESANPNEGRPAAGNRTYGDSASAAVRQATATATQFPGAAPSPYASGQSPTVTPPVPQVPQLPPAVPSASQGGPADALGRSLGAAARPFARVGAALGGGTQSQGQGQGQSQNQRPGGAQTGSPSGARVRKARLRVARLDPWSVMKVSFVLSIAMGIVTVVGTAVVWNVLNALGVFSSLNKTVGDLTSSGSGTTTTTFSLSNFLSFSHVEGYMMIVALVDVVLVTALATLGAYLYNLASGFVGGFEVTLAEDQ